MSSSPVVVSLPEKGIEDLTQLTSARREDLEALGAVQELRLPGNQITTLLTKKSLSDGGAAMFLTQQSVLQPFRNLSTLDLSRNQLTSLVGLSALGGTLATLNVSYNSLVTLEGLERCTKLTWIGAGNNQLESLLGLPEVREETEHNNGQHQQQKKANRARATPLALHIDVKCNRLSRILDILDCPFVLESLASLNATENPFSLVTQIPAVAEKCLQPSVRFIVGGTLEERDVIRGMVGPKIRIESPYDVPRGGSDGHQQSRGRNVQEEEEDDEEEYDESASNNNNVSPDRRPGHLDATLSPPSPSVDEVENEQRALRGESTATTQPPEAPRFKTDSEAGGSRGTSPTRQQQRVPVAQPMMQSFAMQEFTKMNERELIQHLVATREDNTRYEREARDMRKRLTEFKRLVAEDVSRMREMKDELKQKDDENRSLREKLRKKSIENDGLRGQLDAKKDEVLQQKMRSQYHEDNSNSYESEYRRVNSSTRSGGSGTMYNNTTKSYRRNESGNSSSSDIPPGFGGRGAANTSVLSLNGSQFHSQTERSAMYPPRLTSPPRDIVKEDNQRHKSRASSARGPSERSQMNFSSEFSRQLNSNTTNGITTEESLDYTGSRLRANNSTAVELERLRSLVRKQEAHIDLLTSEMDSMSFRMEDILASRLHQVTAEEELVEQELGITEREEDGDEDREEVEEESPASPSRSRNQTARATTSLDRASSSQLYRPQSNTSASAKGSSSPTYSLDVDGTPSSPGGPPRLGPGRATRAGPGFDHNGDGGSW